MDRDDEGIWLGTFPCDYESTIALRTNALRAYEEKPSAMILPGPRSRLGTQTYLLNRSNRTIQPTSEQRRVLLLICDIFLTLLTDGIGPLTIWGGRGESGLASSVPVHSRFDQADNLIHLNIGLAETVFKFNRTFSPIHSRTGNGYALPGTGITGNGIRVRSRLYFGKESDTIPWQETPPCSGNP